MLRHLIIVAGLAAVASGQASSRLGIADLGTLPGGTWAYSSGLSADGTTAIGYAGPGGKAWRWTAATGMTDLGVLPGGMYAGATAVSADGSVVCGWSGKLDSDFGYVDRGFMWTVRGGMVELPPTAGLAHSYASAMSANGKVIIGRTASQGMMWSSGSGTSLSLAPQWSWTELTASNAKGTILAGDGTGPSGGPMVPMRLTAQGGASVLPTYGNGGWVTGMSANGQVISGYVVAPTGVHAAVWTGSTLTDLGVLPGFAGSKACAISADGTVVGGYVGPVYMNPDPSRRAMLWTAQDGMVDANVYLPAHGVSLNGWVLTEIHGVSADGSVLVGDGIHNGQDSRVWMARVGR